MNTETPLSRREGDGAVTIDGLPARDWFEANDVVPVQDRYRGLQDGRLCMCLLTTLAYLKLGGDPDALYAEMDRIGYCRGEQPDPNYRRMDQILANVIGLSRRESLDLEAGWTGSVLDRAVREARGESTALYDLGHDAWEAAKEAHSGTRGTDGTPEGGGG